MTGPTVDDVNKVKAGIAAGFHVTADHVRVADKDGQTQITVTAAPKTFAAANAPDGAQVSDDGASVTFNADKVMKQNDDKSWAIDDKPAKPGEKKNFLQMIMDMIAQALGMDPDTFKPHGQDADAKTQTAPSPAPSNDGQQSDGKGAPAPSATPQRDAGSAGGASVGEAAPGNNAGGNNPPANDADESLGKPSNLRSEATAADEVKNRIGRYGNNGPEVKVVEVHGQKFFSVQGPDTDPVGFGSKVEMKVSAAGKPSFDVEPGAKFDAKSPLEHKFGASLHLTTSSDYKKYDGMKIEDMPPEAAERLKMSAGGKGVLIPYDQLVTNGQVNDQKLNGFLNGWSEMNGSGPVVDPNFKGNTNSTFFQGDALEAGRKALEHDFQAAGDPNAHVSTVLGKDGRPVYEVTGVGNAHDTQNVAATMNKGIDTNVYMGHAKAEGTTLKVDAMEMVGMGYDNKLHVQDSIADLMKHNPAVAAAIKHAGASMVASNTTGGNHTGYNGQTVGQQQAGTGQSIGQDGLIK